MNLPVRQHSLLWGAFSSGTQPPNEWRQVRVKPIVGNVNQFRVIVQHRLKMVVQWLHGGGCGGCGGCQSACPLALGSPVWVVPWEQKADGERDGHMPGTVDVLVVVFCLHESKQGQADGGQQNAGKQVCQPVVNRRMARPRMVASVAPRCCKKKTP